MAELGDSTTAGRRISSAQSTRPVTVLPDPGGATMCKSLFPSVNFFRAISTTSCCDGRSCPLKRICGNCWSICLLEHARNELVAILNSQHCEVEQTGRVNYTNAHSFSELRYINAG